MEYKCCQCKRIKSKFEFCLAKNLKRGVQWQCKLCQREYRRINRETIKVRHKKYYDSNRKIVREKATQQRDKFRKAIIENYGSACAFCSFSDERALQLDHINGDGFKEKKDATYYKKHAQEPDRKRYQLLCANCNWIKRYEDDRIHRRSK